MDKPSFMERIGEGVGLGLVFAAILGWGVLAHALQDSTFRVPTSHSMVLRP